MERQDFLKQTFNVNLLISQGKYEKAEAILSRLAGVEMVDFDILRMMVVVKISLKKYNDAEGIAKLMIAEFPDESLPYYFMANLSSIDRNFDESQQLMDDAIRIDPTIALYHAYKAQLYNQQNQFDQALASANNALSIDSEDTDALNARTTALMGLNLKEAAFETIDKALQIDPNNSETHANMGWSLLHQGKIEKALEHFKISLSIDPSDKYALSGMQESMKSKFAVYAYFLMIMMRLSNLTKKYKWGLVLSAYVFYNVMGHFAKTYDTLQPFLIPILILLGIFFISSWIFSPLMNLYLLSNPFGKFTLTEEKKKSAKLVGLSLVLCFVFLLGYAFSPSNESLLYGAMISFLMMIPLGSMYNAYFESNRKKLSTFAIILALVAVLDIMFCLISGTFGSHLSLGTAVLFITYQLFANYIFINE